jgi:hypothetical protein
MTPEERDEWARRGQWMILAAGTAYEKRIPPYGASILIYELDNGKWLCVQHSAWKTGMGLQQRNYIKAGADEQGKPVGTTWPKAVEAAERTIRWANQDQNKTNHRRKRYNRWERKEEDE